MLFLTALARKLVNCNKFSIKLSCLLSLSLHFNMQIILLCWLRHLSVHSSNTNKQTPELIVLHDWLWGFPFWAELLTMDDVNDGKRSPNNWARKHVLLVWNSLKQHNLLTEGRPGPRFISGPDTKVKPSLQRTDLVLKISPTWEVGRIREQLGSASLLYSNILPTSRVFRSGYHKNTKMFSISSLLCYDKYAEITHPGTAVQTQLTRAPVRGNDRIVRRRYLHATDF